MAQKKKIKLGPASGITTGILLVIAVILFIGGELGIPGLPSWETVFTQADLTDAPFTTAEAAVHIIDVGQGESILVKTPQGNILLDAGEKENGAQVVSYLQSQGVETLDYVIATHPHADHIGGMAEVIKEMDVKAVIAPRVPENTTPTTMGYKNMLKAIQAKGLKLKLAQPGAEYSLGNGDTHFTIVGPTAPDEETNNNSVVMRLSYKNTSFLLTGDCEKDMEAKILASGADVSADVLSLGHHGSNTSSSQKWLDAVNPRYGAISCGADNSYGHPHREVMQRLQEGEVETYRTDLQGTILFETDGETIAVITTKE